MDTSSSIPSAIPRAARDDKKVSSALYIVLLLLGFLQAATTELFDDEAYYWVYAQFLDWGYFDHPPMIALLVKMGITLCPVNWVFVCSLS